VAPGEMAPVKATIRVPRRAVSGERYGVLLAEVVGRGEGNVKTVHRVGVRIYLSVGPGGEPRSDFEIKKITPGRTREGLPQIKAEVLNTGRRALDLGGSLTMEEVEGPLRAGPFSARMNAALAPGDTAPVVVTLDERLDDGPWRVRLTLASGRIKHTATAEVTFPPPGHWGASVIPDRYRWPLTLAGGLILAPLLLITLRYRRARKRRGA